MVPVNANPRQFWGPSVPLLYSLNNAALCLGVHHSVPIRLPWVGVPGQDISPAAFSHVTTAQSTLLDRTQEQLNSWGAAMPCDSTDRCDQMETMAARQPAPYPENLYAPYKIFRRYCLWSDRGLSQIERMILL
jgi:hypothetical protein